MSPELSSVISDAIKILGPALIAGWLGYKVAKVQLDLKLKEIDKSQEFGARKYLFKLLNERGKLIRDEFGKLAESMSEMLLYASGFESFKDEFGDDFLGFRKNLASYVVHLVNSVPMNVNITKKEMERATLDNIPEFKKLDPCINKVENLSTNDSSFDGLSKNTGILLEVYTLITYCNELVIDKQTEEIFNKYLER